MTEREAGKNPAGEKMENSERVCPEKCERPEDNDKIKNPCIHEENGLCKTKEECIHKKLDTTKGARFISAGTFEFKLKDKIGKAPSPEKVVYEEPEPIGTIAEQEMTEKEPVDQAKLTKEQIENWRKVLSYTMGFVSEILSDETIQRYRDNMQKIINKES